jgi:hypothetical protein
VLVPGEAQLLILRSEKVHSSLEYTFIKSVLCDITYITGLHVHLLLVAEEITI